jgi:3-deoxy-D-manno-octulosonic-acid transferase
LLQAFAKIKDCYPGAKMLIAPRERVRAEEVIKMAENNGFSARRRTVPAANKQDDDVVVLDTIGELGKMYSLGDLVFVGGSLIPHGGHNILEPAIHGKPILVGPHMFNFKQTYALLSERGACIRINDVSQLIDKALFILNNEAVKKEMGSSALAVVEENRGAARKSIACLEEILN